MRYRFLMIFLFMAGMFIFFSTGVLSQDIKPGIINWNEGYISAVGVGTATPSGNRTKDQMAAMRVAEVMAQRSLLEATKEVRIDSNTKVVNMILKEDVISSRIEGTIRGAQVVKRELRWENDVPIATVEMKICLSNNVGGCNTGKSLISALDISHKNEPAVAPPERFNIITDAPGGIPKVDVGMVKPKGIMYDSSKPATGVILDLEGRFFEKQLLPVVITTGEGNKQFTVYSVKTVNPKIIRTYGVVRYADSLEKAKKIDYIGNNPIIIPVSDITKDYVIVISHDGARLIKETTMHGNNYLEEAKVVITSN
ncbi:MAG TPA: hypothetical protein PKW07_11020 [Syntrophorhabdaceae bacterium]|nr:hypothetical protein [Syntrophorhabdaceae bacterium]